MQKRIAKLHSLANASRFICFFRFSIRSKVADRKSKNKVERERTARYIQWHLESSKGDRRWSEPVERFRKGKWGNRVVTTWRESRGFSLHGHVIDASWSIGVFPITRWYIDPSERFGFPCRLREHVAREIPYFPKISMYEHQDARYITATIL